MSDNLTPLEVCEKLIAPRKSLGALIGYKEKAAYSWAKPSKYRLAGDLPVHAQRQILVEFRRRGLNADPAWLIEGAKRSDIEKFLNSLAADKMAAE
ncbi:MAG: hypothetical protein AB3N12_01565 [Ruegeria sp.]